MPNLTTALRDEIWRQARKANRQEIDHIKKVSAGYRRDIARLKRELVLTQKRIASLESNGAGGIGRSPSALSDGVDLNGVRYSARSVRAQRKRLGLSAEDYGKLVGVSQQTIYFWEQGRTKPRAKQLAALFAIRTLGKREASERLAEIS